MSLINLSKTSCKSCYKCVNSCAVKAIKMINEQAETVDDRCINCGHCLAVCPQNARSIVNDVDLIKSAIADNRKLVASVAPSFPAAFNIGDGTKIVTALKLLGFYAVEETAAGAEAVLDIYKKLLREGNYKNFITTSCPASNYLIEKYYPSLIKYMAPVVTPMAAHAKMIKESYGKDAFVVFIGPCVAKKKEAEDYEADGFIDAVITFDELTDWLLEENIDVSSLEKTEFNSKTCREGASFPIVGSILDNSMDEALKSKYETIKIDGTSECMDLFRSMENGEITDVCIEPNICRGGCIGGPGFLDAESSFYNRRKKVKQYVSHKHHKELEAADTDDKKFLTEFEDMHIHRSSASDEEIQNILRKMGKFSKEDELNCGGCGYNTCIEKAQSVAEGMSEPTQCLPFIRSKAESLKNMIFEASPNAIFIIDEDMRILECNPKAEKVFCINAYDAKGKPISMLMDDSDFMKVKSTKENKLNRKITHSKYGAVMIEDIIYLEKQQSILIIMNDITEEEKNKKELTLVKENTLDAAQAVIENQMRVAQEIASLLGETTAETKVILTKLKKLAAEESGGVR